MAAASRTPRRTAASRGRDAISPPLPPSTQWHRAHGRQSRRDKAIKQQLLTPREEQAIVDFVLKADRNGYPARVKDLRRYAAILLRKRASPRGSDHSVIAPACGLTPGKDWPQAFCKRHPELKVARLRALDWRRHEKNIYAKVVHWFDIMRAQLEETSILQENVYNMDETGVLLSVLGSSKYLVSSDMEKTHRGTSSKRTLITAVECISADGRSLPPLIIFPGADLRSNWVCHRAPDWRFACSKKGYMNSAINMEWMRTVFEPLTRERANGKPRILINDGFETHESLEVLTFCFENNIILCRLPSHTSHKLQPCDVSVFGPLKDAYREQVEQLQRRGANTVNKEHFILLYSQAREAAVTTRNIRSGWSKAGLFPFNPSRVLDGMPAPVQDHPAPPPPLGPPQARESSSSQTLVTPTTTEGVHDLYRMLEDKLSANGTLVDPCLQKFLHATERAFADRSLLHEENQSLFKQNDERRLRENTRSRIIKQGDAKIMSWADIEAQQKRMAEADANKRKPPVKRKPRAEFRIPAQQDIGIQGTEGLIPPCPGKAPVARMW
ncbi:hypothetical protein Q7P37_009716 [Cladosporium fusiforme]